MRRMLRCNYYKLRRIEKNQENIIVTDNRDFVKSFSKEFDKLWRNFKEI